MKTDTPFTDKAYAAALEAQIKELREALASIREDAFYHMVRHADERGDRAVLGQIKESAIRALAKHSRSGEGA